MKKHKMMLEGFKKSGIRKTLDFSAPNAFTLAEVLITLAIIGVVAAMTIPTLVTKYQDRVNETRYKKAVSMLSQAMQLSMAEIDSPGNMKNTDLWNCKDKDDVQACYKNATKKLFKSVVLDGEVLLDKMNDTDYYLSYNKFSPSYLLPMAYAEDSETNVWNNVEYAFQVSDGMAFGFMDSDEGLQLILDTNGPSKPNKISKDLYALAVSASGKVSDITPSLAESSSGSECMELLDDPMAWANCVGSALGTSGYEMSGGYCADYKDSENVTQQEIAICGAAGGENRGIYCIHPTEQGSL